MPTRCNWCTDDPIYRKYHDEEWGVPVFDDPTLFEFLILEGAQAGLSWITILKKRENYRRAFHGFDWERIARYTQEDVARLLDDPGIVRNRRKVEAAIQNARGTLEIIREFGSLSAFLWSFVGGTPIQNAWKSHDKVPVTTPEAEAMSRALKKRGFSFVGPTICYAFMQAVGMVNDHTEDCFRFQSPRMPPPKRKTTIRLKINGLHEATFSSILPAKTRKEVPMSIPLTIVARIEAYPDKIDLVKSELLKLIEPTRKEAGCLQYDLHEDNAAPGTFLFFENWETRELWQEHMNNAHLAAYMKATEGAVASFIVQEMRRIS